MFDQLLLCMFVLLSLELYFALQSLNYVTVIFLYVLSVSTLALKYNFDLLFVTLIIVATGAVLMLLVLLFSTYTKETNLRPSYTNLQTLFIVISVVLVTSTIAITPTSIIAYKWVSYFALNSTFTFNATFILHLYIMYLFMLESILLNILIIAGLLMALSVIAKISLLNSLTPMRKLNVSLRLKRLSRRVNSFSSFFRK